MTEQFAYDVFLSHSSKDKTVVRAVAERLKADTFRFRDPLNTDRRAMTQIAKQYALRA